ncbi:thioredoxin-like protein AAED1, chloroplastic [Phoenix dactylifera]|uniref:Thioredoxin-like protein AAED1, chloroplastic n=1 Tax=Phoenix dactylifera TaxID=42345 RepID=A0A8B7C0D1_PHODC|nr:thioredoxin-like protein AAED1, chloroplastic [Phoenix dactylifera]
MAMPLRAAPPATTVWIEARRDRHATTLLRNPKHSSPNPRFSFQRKRSNERSRSLPLVAATSDSLGSKSAVTSEGLTSSLEGVDVFDITGKAIPITDLWKNRKAVVAFARHFGCVLCRKRADLLASKKELMDAAGVALVLIGPGSTDQAKAFVQQTKFKGEVYADPSHSSFNALDFAYGVSTTFTPLAGMKIIQSYIEGYRQDWGLSLKKNTMSRGGWQQGGTLVAGPGVSNISYIHKDKEAGDDPDIEDVVKACCL